VGCDNGNEKKKNKKEKEMENEFFKGQINAKLGKIKAKMGHEE
jgi:hypothetical protein